MLRQMSKIEQGNYRIFDLPRGELFAGLFILGCVNGLAGRIIQSIDQVGLANAVLDTFNISVIVFVACFAGISLVSGEQVGEQVDEIQSADIAVSALLLILMILPISAMSWLAVTALGIYILVFTEVSESRRRGAIILLATTVPMFWSRLLFHLYGHFILSVDASLVGLMLGTHRFGNMVEFADHSGTLLILPGCSSLANMSLAILCWVTVSQTIRHRRRSQDVFWCLLACASVVAVNVTRISLMGLSPSHYQAIHSPAGDTIANSIVLSLTVAISILGVRREAFSRT
jgi:exosortase/archaeosortase family protein